MILEKKVIYQTGAIREFEKPEVCEAIKVANENRLTVGLTPTEWNEREARLKKEHEENTNAPGSAENRIKGDLSGNKSIEHCGELIPGPIFISAEGIKFNRKYNQNTSENHALKEAASQFNDALLDEQAKKIEELTKDKELIKKASLSQLDDFIEIYNLLTKESQKAKRLGKEITRLNKAIHKKNMKIEELRKESSRHLRGKIKVFYENVDLEKMLKDKDAVLSDVAEELRLSKIREKNLTDVSQKYMKENDELKKELDEANKHQQQAYRSCADKNKEIRALKLQISALGKRGNGIDWKRNADAIKLYVNRASHERLWSPISQDICNDQELSFIINHGGKRVKYALRFDGTDIVYECSDPDKKPSFFRDDSVGAVTNQKDCSPVKDTHPTEDNPEEIEIEKAVKLVRKAMKEGRTVTIDYKD